MSARRSIGLFFANKYGCSRLRAASNLSTTKLEMVDLLNFGFEFIVVTSITFIAAIFLSQFANTMKLVAHPGEHRQHVIATPMVGGLAIFAGLSFGIIAFASNYNSILPALLLLCVVGAIDDLSLIHI